MINHPSDKAIEELPTELREKVIDHYLTSPWMQKVMGLIDSYPKVPLVEILWESICCLIQDNENLRSQLDK